MRREKRASGKFMSRRRYLSGKKSVAIQIQCLQGFPGKVTQLHRLHRKNISI